MSESNERHETEMIATRMERALVDELRARAKRNDRTLSAELRQAVRLYLRVGTSDEAPVLPHSE